MLAISLVILGSSVGGIPTADTEEILRAVQQNYGRFSALPGLYVSYTWSYQHIRGHKRAREATIAKVNALGEGKLYARSRRNNGEERQGAWNGSVGTELSFGQYFIRPERGRWLLGSLTYVDHLFYPDGIARLEDPEGINALPGYIGGPDYWLPTALEKNRSNYRVLSQQEVDGVPCVVLEWPGRDRIWLDPTLDYAIRLREFRRKDGVLRDRIHLREFQSVAERISLPRLILHEQYCVQEDGPQLQNQLAGTQTITVNELRVESLPEETFLIPIPQGVRVSDMVRDLNYDVYRSGDDPIARAEAEMRRHLSGNRGPSWGWLLWGIVIAILVVGTSLFAYRRWLRPARAR